MKFLCYCFVSLQRAQAPSLPRQGGENTQDFGGAACGSLLYLLPRCLVSQRGGHPVRPWSLSPTPAPPLRSGPRGWATAGSQEVLELNQRHSVPAPVRLLIKIGLLIISAELWPPRWCTYELGSCLQRPLR